MIHVAKQNPDSLVMVCPQPITRMFRLPRHMGELGPQTHLREIDGCPACTNTNRCRGENGLSREKKFGFWAALRRTGVI
ncbi:hypothetical protein L596_022314 [Steinernema carpocapsae]|uniref:Uncharacterized protein n=1 Tax=Steinernema carpocapsae TaxID=34508 RepID=A0A4U5MLE0_STECR|nr:hypothetical protein L596_022313 [Steinernema carpocapsae]TKR70270.1 hypothetical protein L596_022314 [Steinernema carpocapsae]